MTRRTARPIAALACQPGPSAPQPALMPSRRRRGPLTIRSGATFSSVVCTPRRLKAGSSIASTAASTTGKYSGRQPAITALAATFSTVATPAQRLHLTERGVGARAGWREHLSMRAKRGRHDGQPVGPAAQQEEPVDLGRRIGAADHLDALARELRPPAACARAALSPRRARRSVSSIHSPEARWPAGSSTQSESTGPERRRPRPSRAGSSRRGHSAGSGSASWSGSRGCRCARRRRRWCAADRRSPRPSCPPRDRRSAPAGPDPPTRRRPAGSPGLHEAAQRRPPRHEIRPVADVALELPGRHADQLEEPLLERRPWSSPPLASVSARIGLSRSRGRSAARRAMPTVNMTSQPTCLAMPSARYGSIWSGVLPKTEAMTPPPV